MSDWNIPPFFVNWRCFSSQVWTDNNQQNFRTTQPKNEKILPWIIPYKINLIMLLMIHLLPISRIIYLNNQALPMYKYIEKEVAFCES
jgi:hypothetical protein